MVNATDFYDEADYYAALDERLATPADAVKEYARNVGMDDTSRAWILSHYDTWERNPFYTGPAVPHPEED